MLFKKLKLCFVCRFGSNKAKCDYLRKQGAQIGEGTVINDTPKIFGTEPYLIKCGKDCLFARGSHLITHDGGVRVLNKLNKFDGKAADIFGKIEMGDNVYLGVNAMVMPGVKIGSNVIIGAGAVVTHDIPDNSVAVGVPARVIKTVDEYYEKAKKRVRYTIGMTYQEKREYYSKTNWDGLIPGEMQE